MSEEDNFFKEDSSSGKSSKTPWLLLLLVLGAAAAVGYFGYQQLQNEREDAAKARKAADEATARCSTNEDAKKALETKMEGMAEDNARLANERDGLAQEVKQKDSELSKLKATSDALQDKLKNEIKKGEIRLSQAGGRLQVDMIDKVLFDSGQAELSSHGEDVLGRVGAVLAKVEDRQIQVSGHTDDSPITDKGLKEKFPTNWELSVARAVNVVRYLGEKAGVPRKRLVAAGYGEFHPIATNANPQGRARNRRIEILLTPTLAEKPPAAPAPPAKAPAVTPAAAKKPPGKK